MDVIWVVFLLLLFFFLICSLKAQAICDSGFSGLGNNRDVPVKLTKLFIKGDKYPLSFTMSQLFSKSFIRRIKGLNYLYYNLQEIKERDAEAYQLFYDRVFEMATSDTNTIVKRRAFGVLYEVDPQNRDLAVLEEVNPIFNGYIKGRTEEEIEEVHMVQDEIYQGPYYLY